MQCPYCARRFNQKAAERHINFCKEQQSRIPNRPAKADPAAKAKMAARNTVRLENFGVIFLLLQTQIKYCAYQHIVR